MARNGERVEIEGVGAWYSASEMKVLRSMSRSLIPAGEAWRQIMLIHGLKAHLGATIVDADEEAVIRRAWAALEQESAAPDPAGQLAEKAGDLQPDYGSSVGPQLPPVGAHRYDVKRTELKRKSPLARTPLDRSIPPRPEPRPCDECEKEYRPVWTGLSWSKVCSVSCVRAGRPPVAPGDLADPARHVSARRAPVRRRTQQQRTADNRRWKSGASLVCEIPGCVFCERHRSHPTQHHVVYVQRLRTLKADAWDPRNRMTVCNDAHMAHHRRSKVIEAAHLPDSAYAFAREIMGPGAAYEYLRRRYAGDDPRLDALDAEWRLAVDTTAH